MAVVTTLEQVMNTAFGYHKAEHYDLAAQLYEQVLQNFPDLSDALHLLGLVRRRQGRLEEAETLMKRALAQQPLLSEIYYNLGNLYQAQGRLPEALHAFICAVILRPDLLDSFKNLGNVWQNMGRLDHALAAYQMSLSIDPNCAESHNNIGAALQAQGRIEAAIAAYHRAVAARPDYAEAYNNLGMTLHTVGRSREAIAAHKRALALRPDYAECYSNFGSVLVSAGQLPEALQSYRRSLQIRPDFAEAHSNLVLTFNYLSGYTAREVYELHRDYNQRHGVPLAARIKPHPNRRDPERRLRIGYYSPDFRRHSCAFFFLPLLEARDRQQVDVYCYAHVKNPDDYTQHIRNSADHWISATGMPAEWLAAQVRADGIDILVDMAGHFADHRLRAFAEKPAPVQVTWLGYPNTTGLTAIDYRFTDSWADPEGEADTLHSERLVRLPRGFLCFRPPEDAPAVVPPPCRDQGQITFGSFNNFNKISPPVYALWASILHQVPGSRLVLKAVGLNDDGIRQRCYDQFALHGITADRLAILQWTNHPVDHLALYGQVDIALDSFPYNGTTTTCEALWMGVPVVALAGDRHAARVGVSVLSRAGLSGLVAATPEHYIGLAIALARDPERLAALRASLRERLSASMLCDAAGFARQVEAAYRDMWRRWCQSPG